MKSFYRNESLITKINASVIEKLYKSNLMANIYLYLSNQDIEDNPENNPVEQKVKSFYEKIINLAGFERGKIPTEKSVYISVILEPYAKAYKNMVELLHLFDTAKNNNNNNTESKSSKSKKTDIEESINSKINNLLSKERDLVQELKEDLENVDNTLNNLKTKNFDFDSMLRAIKQKLYYDAYSRFRGSVPKTIERLKDILSKKEIEYLEENKGIEMKNLKRKIDEIDDRMAYGIRLAEYRLDKEEFTKELETLSQIFFDEKEIKNLSEQEKIVLSYLYRYMEKMDRDVFKYLGDVLKGQSQREKRFDEYSTEKTYGFNLSKMTTDNILDEDLFNLKIAKGELKIRNQDEEPAGYGSFIMAIDYSGSMYFDNKLLKAQAVALYYGIQAIRKGIDFGVIEFAEFSFGYLIKGNTKEEKYIDFLKKISGGITKEEITKNKDKEYFGKQLDSLAEQRTNYIDALNMALYMVKNTELKYKNADLLFITDGEPNLAWIKSCPDMIGFTNYDYDYLDRRKWEKMGEEFRAYFRNSIMVGIGFVDDWSYKERYKDNFFTRDMFLSSKDFHIDVAKNVSLDDFYTKHYGGLKL